MKITKYLSILLVLLLMLLISSCGANSPTTAGTSSNKPPINSPAISAYQDTTHSDMITRNAIDLLLTSGNLTEKQKKLLIFYKISIEQGALDEDYAPIGIPIFRTPNHFWDPIYNTA